MACQVTRSFANRACLGRAGKATAAVPRYRRINCVDAKTMAGSSTGGHNDEAHVWLNGYANKQNCRIWSEANPQVYVETPLHPEKLTVWCALWAGGILLPKR
ncbi:uncharacterized protein TNCV_4600891 [Trichonephila clavipes]|nr:uncharacterized protein TNCV_4600891 [Trichonephila clavipes]